MESCKKAFRKPVNVILQMIGICALLISYLLRLSKPKTKGKMRAEGLESSIEIVRDQWGVPHLQGKTLQDIFFGCGIAHAQDRLWQLELWRRAASGTLSEIFGERTLAADRFMRRIGLRRNAEEQLPSLPEHSLVALEAYSRGINTVLKNLPWWRLPVEFLLLRFRPQPWTSTDSATIAKLIGFLFSPNWDAQIVRLWLIEKLGPKTASILEPLPMSLSLLTPRTKTYDSKDMELLDEYAEVSSWLSSITSASNVWAVDGAKTASGKPILANDVHTPPTTPSFWYELHVITPDHNIIGVSIPGFPGVIAGRNSHIAWGVSVGLANQQGLFVEKLNADQTQYEYEGQWYKGALITENIRIRGQKPAQEQIFITRHGPIINPLISGTRRALAFKSVALESLGLVTSAEKLMLARNWEEFREALTLWSSPSMNFVYADRDGHIGWQLAGFIPARPSSGLVPARGWKAQDDWEEYIAFALLPSTFDPDSHIAAAANNQPSDARFIRLSGEWADPYRVRRITDILAAQDNLTLKKAAAVQGDVYSLVAEEILPFVFGLNPKDDELRWMINMLRQWDLRITKSSIAAAIFEVFAYRLYRNIFSEKLGEDLDYYLGKGVHTVAHINALGYRAASNLSRILSSLPEDWFLRTNPEDSQRSLTKVLEQSLREAFAYLTEKAGKDRRKWQWGRIHKVTFSHVFGQLLILRKIFNVGAYPLDGDINTVPQASYNPMQPFNCTASVVTWRHIFDFANPEESLSVLPPGQSGQAGNKHFRNQLTLWLHNEYHPLVSSEALIRKYAKETLRVIPFLKT